MKTRFAALAAIAMIAMATAAMAQTSGGAMSSGAMSGGTMSGDAMHASKMMAPTMVCRPVAKGETATAKMMDGDAVVCKKIDMSKLTADQQKLVMDNLSIPLSSGEQVPIQPHQ